MNPCFHRFTGIIGIDKVHRDNARKMIRPQPTEIKDTLSIPKNC